MFNILFTILCFLYSVNGQISMTRTQHLDRVNTLYSTLDTWWADWKYPELNEGIYTNDNTTYDEAIENVYAWWIKSGDITNGTRVLELGFGYSMLGYKVIENGGIWTGINNNIDQVNYAKNKLGLNALLGDWRDIPSNFIGEFDVIFARGCLEHFIYHNEAIANQSTRLYGELMTNLTSYLDPLSANRRIVMSMMRYRNPVDPLIFTKKYSDFPEFSDAYYLNIINRWWGGYYPNSLNEVLGHISHLNMNMIDYVDDTYDYYRTSIDWNRQMYEDLYTISFYKNVWQLIKTLWNRYDDIDEAIMAYKTGAWQWQWNPKIDKIGFTDTPVINARWVLRDLSLENGNGTVQYSMFNVKCPMFNTQCPVKII
jgi:cyclopropane fatty-acyl-phospholipid synthase-like methyltransferase